MNWTKEDIRALLNEHGLTQSELARRVGVTRYAVCNWLSGNRNPSTLAKRELNRIAAKQKGKK